MYQACLILQSHGTHTPEDGNGPGPIDTHTPEVGYDIKPDHAYH